MTEADQAPASEIPTYYFLTAVKKYANTQQGKPWENQGENKKKKEKNYASNCAQNYVNQSDLQQRYIETEKKGVEKKVTAKKAEENLTAPQTEGIFKMSEAHTHAQKEKENAIQKKKEKQERLKNAGKITRKQQEA